MRHRVSRAALVLDCGATNVRAIAVSADGQTLATRSVPNAPSPDPGLPGGKIWDHERIWRDFSSCARAVVAEVGAERMGALTVTTFGVDGALVDQHGTPLYPMIAWPCGRTTAMVAEVEDVVPGLYQRCGLQPFAFNTIYKLAWLARHRPEVLDRARAWLFISNLFVHRMTGVMATDVTMAGTSMLTDGKTRRFSPETCGALGLDAALFPPLVEPGTVVGNLRDQAAADLGLPPGLPVVSAGHDTQFALFGSGANEDEPVLSSGTWDILMLRSRRLQPTEILRSHGVTLELDVEPGLLDPGAIWIASGLVEWLRRLAFGELAGAAAYAAMIAEGSAAAPGSGGLRFSGDVLANQAALAGLGLETSRGQLARALFEHLAGKTRAALHLLEQAGGFRAAALLCVGGGSKNRLWNQIRADVLGRPLRLVEQQETTVLGAACFALPATGAFRDAREARAAANLSSVVLEPGPDAGLYAGYQP